MGWTLWNFLMNLMLSDMATAHVQLPVFIKGRQIMRVHVVPGVPLLVSKRFLNSGAQILETNTFILKIHVTTEWANEKMAPSSARPGDDDPPTSIEVDVLSAQMGENTNLTDDDQVMDGDRKPRVS